MYCDFASLFSLSLLVAGGAGFGFPYHWCYEIPMREEWLLCRTIGGRGSHRGFLSYRCVCFGFVIFLKYTSIAHATCIMDSESCLFGFWMSSRAGEIVTTLGDIPTWVICYSGRCWELLLEI
ncbi:hypothetical protein P154DRAFT_11069 [Amniculicola lignicola CBS 123094]|uniref:Uncharacterized protein n=1 Tax=Amniculicola lignicola CBS 123094 TaxID=1392246 RepID=A0A6A5X4M3_9PLEO|nr:hypothetical protein P154DRAFT_11069 [Amniculicola lignicola CBS 123094]